MKKIETKYLIIGNSTASVSCVEAIRGIDIKGTITLVSSETEHTYSRPLITYLLSGLISPERLYYRPFDFYEKNRVNAMLGRKATGLNASSSSVTLATEEEIIFERLLIATGGTPILPRIPGVESEGVFTFFSWKDAERVKKFILTRKINRAVVVGGGLIGLKTLEALLSLDVKTDLVEKAPHVLGAVLDDTAANMIHKRLADANVNLYCGTTVKEIMTKNDLASGIRLENNREIECELIILAIGVTPNAGFLAETGILIDKGVIVNSRMLTNLPNIFAAGDVTQSHDLLTGTCRNIALFPSAFKQGQVAGINMAGGDVESPGGIVMNSVSVTGLPVISVGNVHDTGKETETRTFLDEKNSVYKKLLLNKGKITGALFVKQVDRAGIYTGMIKSGLDASEISNALLTDAFGLLNLPKTYRKYVVSGVGIEV